MSAEVTLKLNDPQATLAVLGEAAIEFDNDFHAASVAVVNELRDQIRAQIVIPPPAEPKEFGSIVRARVTAHAELSLWVRQSNGPWYSEHGAYVGEYRDLRDVEVLRVGIGGDR